MPYQQVQIQLEDEKSRPKNLNPGTAQNSQVEKFFKTVKLNY